MKFAEFLWYFSNGKKVQQLQTLKKLSINVLFTCMSLQINNAFRDIIQPINVCRQVIKKWAVTVARNVINHRHNHSSFQVLRLLNINLNIIIFVCSTTLYTNVQPLLSLWPPFDIGLFQVFKKVDETKRTTKPTLV